MRQVFTTVLLEHIIYAGSVEDGSFASINSLLPHVFDLVPSFPLSSATFFVRKLALMQKNLARGLAAGSLTATSKTWPGMGEITLLRLIGIIWSTSDLSHPVAAPALLLISQYLGQCRVRSLADLAKGSFLVTLTMQYEQLSKRLVPEALNFIMQGLLLILPNLLDNEDSSIPGNFPLPDFRRDELKPLKLNPTKATTQAEALDLTLPAALSCSDNDEHTKVALTSLLLGALGELAGFYNTLPAFIELFQPTLDVLDSIETQRISSSLQVR